MRWCSLGSGSRGNGTLIETGGFCVLVDCGFTWRQLQRRLADAGLAPSDLDAVLVTHEHSDHASGVGNLMRRTGVPVGATTGTWRGMGLAPRRADLVVAPDARLRIGPFEVEAVTVPHDANEPVQYVFAARRRRLGVLTDLGHPTPHVAARYHGCDALLLEVNHDPQMLAGGRYPPALKRRVGGRFGHLSNVQAAGLLACLNPERLQHVLGAHLSEQNNTPAAADAELRRVIERTDATLRLAVQDAPSGWMALD